MTVFLTKPQLHVEFGIRRGGVSPGDHVEVGQSVAVHVGGKDSADDVARVVGVWRCEAPIKLSQ